MQGIEAGWRGDHTFNSGATIYSLEHFLEPEVQINHPHWTSDQVRSEAMRRMELRLAQDKLFTGKETDRDGEMTTRWEVQDIDGRPQLVTRYGDSHISLETLWRHTEEYAERIGVPEAFNREEMKMQLAIQDALILKKATGAALALSHPDSIRYVQTWTVGRDGTFYSKQIDVGMKMGRDLKHQEVDGFIGKIRDTFAKQTVMLDGVGQYSYVTVRGVIDENTVTRTATLFAQSRQLTPYDRLTESRYPRPLIGVLHEPRFTPNERTHEVYPIKLQPVDYLRAIRDPRFIEEPRHASVPRPRLSDRIITIVPFVTESTRELPRRTEKSEPKEQSLPKTLEKVYKESVATIQELVIIQKSGIGFGAIPVLLEKLTIEPPLEIKHVEKSIRRKRRKKEKLAKATHQKEAVSIKRNTLLYERKPLKKESQRRSISIGKEKRATKRRRPPTQAIEKRLEKPVRKQKDTVKRKERRTRSRSEAPEKREARLLRAHRRRRLARERRLHATVRPEHVKRHSLERVITRRVVRRMIWMEVHKPLKRKENKKIFLNEKAKKRIETIVPKHRHEDVVPVSRFMFGWAVFLLLGRGDRPLQKDSSSVRLKKRDVMIKKGMRTWVLLSIIWHLAMIRESGRGSKRQQPVMPAQACLPARQGVIFVANS